MTPVENLQSIMQRGILSHRRAERLQHASIADQDVQDRRAGKRVPGGRMLHEYANVYFDARNAMMYRRRGQRDAVAVVRIDPAILDLEGVVITDGNAASGPTLFLSSPDGLAQLDADRVYARYWTSDDPWVELEQKRQRQAEVLVPDRIAPGFFLGCFVYNDSVRPSCNALAPNLAVEVNADVFFAS